MLSSDPCEEALLTFNLGVEYSAALAEIVNAYDLRHGIVRCGADKLGIHVFAACEKRLVEGAAVFTGVECDVKCACFDEILEEVTAVA